MSRVLPWSYSSLTGYETCPYRYEQERILKVIPKKVYKEADEGVKKHEAIELYLKGTQALNDKRLQKLVDETLAHLNPIHFKYEHKLAVKKDRSPCEWDDPECYHRGILDVMYVDPNAKTAAIFDWKNGKVNEYSEQLKANSICVMAHYPHVDSVHTEYVWMKFDKRTQAKNYRDFSEPVWQKFVRRVDRLENALMTGDWPKRPSGLCKKYCPVVKCEHNGEYVNG